jgi:nucleotide-binding universal stress UspA family protein
MAFKDILVCLDPTASGRGRLRLAAGIAREHRAHLSAAYVLPNEAPTAPPSGGPGITVPTGAAWMPPGSLGAGVPGPGVAPTAGAALAEIIEERFREEVRPHTIEGDWHMFGTGDGADLVALLSAVDLVVFGQASPDDRVSAGFRPEDIVVGCGRPVLVVPYAGAFDRVGRRVLVAWDATREASRALHDALPLIGKAEAVTVMTVPSREAASDEDGSSLHRIVRHLGRHGIPARSEETPRGDMAVSDVLLSRAADLDVDLIVAGAYHHSQFREALLGGVSRELLDHMTVPVLMSH